LQDSFLKEFQRKGEKGKREKDGFRVCSAGVSGRLMHADSALSVGERGMVLNWIEESLRILMEKTQ
jgi:hypothetical protein